MNLGLKLQHNMTSCQGLVPADLKPNHLTKWILPLHKRGVLFESYLLFLPPLLSPSFSSALLSNSERRPGSSNPLDEVLLCMAGDN